MSHIFEGEMAGPSGALGTRKAVLEVFKFGCYVAIPIVMMAAFAYNSDNLARVIRNRSYVVYPPDGPRPTTEDIIEMVRKSRSES